MTTCLEALAGVGDSGPVHLEYGKILVGVVADIQIASIRRERDGLWKYADFNRAARGHILALNAQNPDAAVRMVEPLGLHVRAIHVKGRCNIALRTNRQ